MNHRWLFPILFLSLFLAGTLYSQSPDNHWLIDHYKNLYQSTFTSSFPKDDSILTVLGRWAWGPCLSVDADSNFAYIANGSTFQILDIKNPVEPHILGEFVANGFITQIRVRGNTAFLCIGSGLLILDITQLALPKQISFIAISGVAVNFALGDSFVYVGTITGLLKVIDISDLTNPYFRGSIPKFSEITSCLEVKDRFIYLDGPEYPFVQIIDATNPDSLINNISDLGGLLTSAFIKDTLLFGSILFGSNYLRVFNISNKLEPQLIGSVLLSDSVIAGAVTITQDGLTAYTLNTISSQPTLTKEGIYSIDISNLAQPVVKAKFFKETQQGSNAIALSKNTLIGAYYSGVSILDANDPDTLISKSFFATGGFSEKIKIRYPYFVLASGLSGIWILDVTNQEEPQPISNIQTGSYISDLLVEDSLIYAVDWAAYSAYEGSDTSRGLWIIDIRDIYHPEILSHYIGITHGALQEVPNSISKSGNMIYITQVPTVNDSNILEIIDVSNPYLPHNVGIFHGSTAPYGVAINDTIVYLATEGGLNIIDVSDPGEPVKISSVLDITRGVVYKAPYLYAASSQFSIINITDPVNPFVIGSTNLPPGSGGTIDLVLDKNFAYSAELYLSVIDIADPDTPTQIAALSGWDAGRGAAYYGDKIYFSDRAFGVWILKNKLITTGIENRTQDKPTEFTLAQNYPNPFNSLTKIKYTLNKEGLVKLNVYDILGSGVANLVHRWQKPGEYTVNFNAAGLSSGIYIYRLNVAGYNSERKMLFLK